MACNDECLSDINTSLQLIASKLDSLYNSFNFVFFKNDQVASINSVFKYNTSISISDVFKRAFFAVPDSGIPTRNNSVFSFHLSAGNDETKILNHSCSVNPLNISFCSDYNIKTSLDNINLSINSVKTSIDSIDENKTVVNEIIVDDNLNVNISKPNYHFDDSDNNGFWGR